MGASGVLVCVFGWWWAFLALVGVSGVPLGVSWVLVGVSGVLLGFSCVLLVCSSGVCSLVLLVWCGFLCVLLPLKVYVFYLNQFSALEFDFALERHSSRPLGRFRLGLNSTLFWRFPLVLPDV